MASLTCWGGPFDGTPVSVRSSSGAFAYVSSAGDAHDKPGTGRVLHRVESLGSKRRKVWRYVDLYWFRCVRCGAFHRRAEGGQEAPPSCNLCGETTDGG